MAFKLYGYGQSDDAELLELREVTILVDAEQARALSEFLARCAQKMEANPAWEHEHFAGEEATDLVVFNLHSMQEKKML